MRWKPYLTPTRDMNAEEAKAFLAGHREGDYNLLDVRQPAEYEEAHIPGGYLIPLPELTDRMNELDPSKPTVIYCRSGNRSRMATQYLSGQGFKEVYNLGGGILAWRGLRAAGSIDGRMHFITGKESPAEILLLAYAMEEGLREFYERMGSGGSNPLASRLFDKLAVIEVRHKEMVFDLYREHNPEIESPEALEDRVLPSVMEGGITTEELLATNKNVLTTVQDIVAMAMTIEAQGLDLYLRYGQRSEKSATREVLNLLADEEKAHLALLGNLLDKYEV